MDDLRAAARLDPELVVEHLRKVLADSPSASARSWAPQATFDELLRRMNREQIHFHPAIHHLHRHWNIPGLPAAPAGGRGLKSRLRQFVHRYLESVFAAYFQDEREFRAALARSIDALAYRIDEVASADERNLLELVRDDLFDLARYVEARTGATRAPAGRN